MAIELDCPKCGLTVKITEALIGKKLRCKKCQEAFFAEDPHSPFEEVLDFEVVEDEPKPRRKGSKGSQRQDREDDAFRPRRGGRLPRSELRSIALYQRALLFCIAASITFHVLLAIEPHVLIICAMAAVGITGAVFVFLLSIQLYGTPVGVVLAVLAMIPILGLLVIAVVNSKATSTLNKHGCDVGFLGASLSQFD